MKNYKYKEKKTNGSMYYYNEFDKLHRIDGPAIEDADGSKSWFINGEHHRTDGPAFEERNGTKWWYINGLIHRIDGPAVEYQDGSTEWWFFDEEMKVSEYLKLQKFREIFNDDNLLNWLLLEKKIVL